jgi:hypothetical protein
LHPQDNNNLVDFNIGKLIVDLIEINISKVLIGTMPSNNNIINARNTLIQMLNTLNSIDFSNKLINSISFQHFFSSAVLDRGNILFQFILETIKIEFKLSAKSITNKLVGDNSIN